MERMEFDETIFKKKLFKVSGLHTYASIAKKVYPKEPIRAESLRASLGSWCNESNGREPKISDLILIANTFNCSLDDLVSDSKDKDGLIDFATFEKIYESSEININLLQKVLIGLFAFYAVFGRQIDLQPPVFEDIDDYDEMKMEIPRFAAMDNFIHKISLFDRMREDLKGLGIDVYNNAIKNLIDDCAIGLKEEITKNSMTVNQNCDIIPLAAPSSTGDDGAATDGSI